MQIWLVRHAVAAERDEFPGPDWERPLTEKGRKRFRSFARRLAAEVAPPELIVTSPLVRAAETARILRKEFGLGKEELLTSDILACGAEPGAVLRLAREHGRPSIALVGHEPDFSHALSEFVGGGQFIFAKGAIAAIDFQGDVDLGAGRLCWFVEPKFGA